MPDQSSNLTALRANGHRRAVYVSVMTGDVVLNATVSSTPVNPATNIAITVNSGSASDVKRGMRVVIENASGVYKGTLHIRAAGTISATNIPVREFSSSWVQVESGDTLKVYDDWQITDKLVADDETFAPDDETYSDQFSDPKPLVCSGGWYAGWASDAAAVPFDGSGSLNLDPDTANTLTHAWATSGGTLSNAAAQQPTIDFTGAGAGKYLVTHTVTAANSKSRTQHVRVRLHDAGDPPLLVTEESGLSADPENGWTYSFRVYENATLTAIPDGAPVVIWVDETINGTRQSFGSKVSGRSHIKCAGYLRRDRSGWDADAGMHYVIFDVVSPLARLSELPGFSKVMINRASPDEWNEVKTLTVKRAMVYLALYYTNYNEAGHDIVFDDDDMTEKLYSRFYLQKATPVGQLRELAEGVDCRVTCDRLGRMEIQQFLPYVAFASRSDPATTLSITAADIIDYEAEREHYEPVETFRMRGFRAGSTRNKPLFARWPGDAPGTGNQSETQEKIIADSAQDLYNRCGRHGAWRNRTYTRSNGVKRHAPKMRVTLPGSYDVFDLYREWVGVTFTGNLRGLDPTDFRWFVEGIEYQSDGGTGRVVLQLQAETNGLEGVDDTPPTEEDDPLPDYTPPSTVFDPFPITVTYPPTGLARGIGTLAAFLSNNTYAITNDWTTDEAAGGPTYATTDLTSLANWGGGTLLQFEVDAFSPKYLGTGTAVNGWLLTTTHWQPIYDIFGTPTLGTAVALTGNVTTRQMRTERGTQNYVVIVSYISGTGVFVNVSTDGTTLSANRAVTTHYDSTASLTHIPGLALSAHSGRILVSAFASTAAYPSFSAQGYQSSNQGTSWSAASSPSIGSTNDGLAHEIHVPFTDDTTAFYGYWVDGGGSLRYPRLYKVVGTGTPVNVSPTVSGAQYGAGHGNKQSIVTTDSNKNNVLFIGTNDNSASRKFGVWKATDGVQSASSWQLVVTPSTSVGYRSCHMASANTWYLWGLNALAYTTNGGATIEDKRGNLSLSGVTVLNICGG